MGRGTRQRMGGGALLSGGPAGPGGPARGAAAAAPCWPRRLHVGRSPARTHGLLLVGLAVRKARGGARLAAEEAAQVGALRRVVSVVGAGGGRQRRVAPGGGGRLWRRRRRPGPRRAAPRAPPACRPPAAPSTAVPPRRGARGTPTSDRRAPRGCGAPAAPRRRQRAIGVATGPAAALGPRRTPARAAAGTHLLVAGALLHGVALGALRGRFGGVCGGPGVRRGPRAPGAPQGAPSRRDAAAGRPGRPRYAATLVLKIFSPAARSPAGASAKEAIWWCAWGSAGAASPKGVGRGEGVRV
jgi:hypothetical protein